jgi:hypothetical protein
VRSDQIENEREVDMIKGRTWEHNLGSKLKHITMIDSHQLLDLTLKTS